MVLDNIEERDNIYTEFYLKLIQLMRISEKLVLEVLTGIINLKDLKTQIL